MWEKLTFNFIPVKMVNLTFINYLPHSIIKNPVNLSEIIHLFSERLLCTKHDVNDCDVYKNK